MKYPRQRSENILTCFQCKSNVSNCLVKSGFISLNSSAVTDRTSRQDNGRTLIPSFNISLILASLEIVLICNFGCCYKAFISALRIKYRSPRGHQHGYTRVAFAQVFHWLTHRSYWTTIDWMLQPISLIRHITTWLEFHNRVMTFDRLIMQSVMVGLDG